MGSRPVGNQVGYQAPDFALPLLAGGQVKLQSLQGKAVIVAFWASWCGPCRKEIPALETAWKDNKEDDLLILGVSLDDKREMAERFLTFFPATFPNAFDQGGSEVGNPWGVQSIPMTLLLDREGVIRSRHLGYTPDTVPNLIAEASALLRETAK